MPDVYGGNIEAFNFYPYRNCIADTLEPAECVGNIGYTLANDKKQIVWELSLGRRTPIDREAKQVWPVANML